MLLEKAQLEDNRHAARRGMMRAAFKAREWEDAIQAADLFRADTRISEEEKREAGSLLAKAYMATSRRAEALSLLEELAAAPSTPEGAEACYLLIQDRFDRLIESANAVSAAAKAKIEALGGSVEIVSDVLK